jgi:putative Mg2+ transporter-C (MgtC) family protein
MDTTEQLFIFLNIVITCILTAFIGIEREEADKPAGVRTNMIVGASSCLFVSIIPSLIEFIQDSNFYDKVVPDPIRALQAIVIGIGFIGAGTIIKRGDDNSVSGLTTAATLLFSAGIGITVACQLYILAVCITLLLLFINRGIEKIIQRSPIKKHKK